MDTFCEKNRSWLGIQLKESQAEGDGPEHIRLFLTNSLNGSPFRGNEDTIPEVPYLVINCYKETIYDFSARYEEDSDSSRSSSFRYSSERECKVDIPSFCIEMTEENVNRIKKSLSGFAFSSLGIINGCGDSIDEDSFIDIMPHFVEAIADLNITRLFVKDVPPTVIAILDYAQDIRRVDFDLPYQNTARYVHLDLLERVESVYFNTVIDCYFLEKVAQGKKSIKFAETGLKITESWKSLAKIFAGYKKTSKYPDLFYIQLIDGRRYVDINVHDKWTRLLPKTSVYLGWFLPPAQRKTSKFDSNSWNIWLNKVAGPSEKWQLFTVRRHALFLSDNYTGVEFTAEILTTKEDLFKKLMELCSRIILHNYGSPHLNFDAFWYKFEKLKTAQEIKAQFIWANNFLSKFVK